MSTQQLQEGIEIGYEEPVVIHNINNGEPINGKIDTGADMCSMHAENIQVQNGNVQFSINGKVYRMSLARTQTVKQADSDTEERPVVKFTFELGGQTISDVECNINDRTGMSPLLIGKNLLSKADFNINTQDVNADAGIGLGEGVEDLEDVEGDDMLEPTDEIDPSVEDGEAPAQDELKDEREVALQTAFDILLQHDCTVREMMEFLRNSPIASDLEQQD